MSRHSQIDPLVDWRRSATVLAVALVGDRDTHQSAKQLYGSEGPGAVLKAAVTPAATDGWGNQLATTRVGAFLQSLRPRSAAAQLIERGTRIDLAGARTVRLPRRAAGYPEPNWVGEGDPIPAQVGVLGSDLLGPPKKIATIAGLTSELRDLSAENAETIIGDLMLDASARALDAGMFSNAPATDIRPAGLLAGVTAITAKAGGGMAAMTGDLVALVGAIHAAGGGSDIVLVAAPTQALMIKLLAGSAFDVPVIVAPNLVAGTVIAIEAGAFVSGFNDVPEIAPSSAAVVHWDDTPAQIGTDASPDVVAAPVMSGFQTNTHALRLILRAAWVMRQPGTVQFVTGTTW